MKWSKKIGLSAAVLLVGSASAALLSGCSQQAAPPATTDASAQASATTATPVAAPAADPAATTGDGEHGHKPGQHGGIIASLGRDSYHVEAVIENDGTIRLYTLGNDESRVIDIEMQELKGYVKAEGATDSASITFTPSPQDGDAQGRTSLFVAKLPEGLASQAIEVTVPNVRIDGERFRLGFQSNTGSHGDDVAMPDAIGVDEEKELYLQPQSKYTLADIEANGNTIPSVKFKGIRSAHDMFPKVGDKVCPITLTKANAKFTWTINGEDYEFCCPPCIDEFVRTAKDSDEPLPAASTFVKK